MTREESTPLYWLTEAHTPDDLYAHGIRRVIAQCQTPFQELCVVETGVYGKSLVLDGRWQVSTGDEFLYHEPLVHTPCVLHGQPQTVLILGGGDGGSLREVLRWKTVETVVLVDIDGDVIEVCKQYLPELHQNCWDDPRVTVEVGDAQDYLQQTDIIWDVIISDLTDPVEAGPAYPLFTLEHFARIKAILNPRGFYMMQGGSLNPPELPIHSRTVHTLQQVFGQVQTCFCYTPTYGVALGLILATPALNWAKGTSSPDPFGINPLAVDCLLAEQVTGTLRMFDGVALRGLLNVPKYIRQAIATETQVYTLDNPPQIKR